MDSKLIGLHRRLKLEAPHAAKSYTRYIPVPPD